MRQMKSMTSWMVLSALALGFASTAAATDINLGKHIEAVKVSGDFRLRQETFSNDTSSTTANLNTGRNRQRYRLRLGVELPLNPRLTARVRLASGTGEQTSTNQSFDNLSSQNGIWIDQAMVEYRPFDFLKLTSGRMPLPLWTVYTSDILWDGDFSPMGVGVGFEKLLGPTVLFANGMYMVTDEDSNNSQGLDQSEVSYQLGGEFKLPMESRIRVGFAQHQWINERAGSFGSGSATATELTGAVVAPIRQNGNRRNAAGVLLNEYRVNEITGQFSFWVAAIPVAVQGTFITNMDALDPTTIATPSGLTAAGHISGKKDKGSQIGAIIGKARAAKSWEVAYFQKTSEYDATVADVADSDFGNGGTGRKASIMWIAYAPYEYMTFSAKYFQTELEDGDNFPLTSGTGMSKHDLDRLQVDFQVKF